VRFFAQGVTSKQNDREARLTMTDQRDQATESRDAGVEAPVGQPDTPDLSRRAMLRGATVAVPTILTLGSGAALAASSNLLGTNQTPTTTDVNCLNPASTQGTLPTNPNVYDLGAPPYGEVTVIPSTNRYRNKATGLDITTSEACQLNGTVQVKYNGSGPWVDKTRTAGAMASAAAMASFGSRIVKTYI
jgi:hypothetical protein